MRVVLTVPDFDEAVAFYRDTLGSRAARRLERRGRTRDPARTQVTRRSSCSTSGKPRASTGSRRGAACPARCGLRSGSTTSRQPRAGSWRPVPRRCAEPVVAAVGRPQRAPPYARRHAADAVQRAVGRLNGGVTTTAVWDELLVGDELAHLATEPAREARTAPLPDSLQPALREALAGRGIHELYTHQAETYAGARAGAAT